MDAQLREVIGFLRDRNPQVRQLALSNLLAFTPKESPYRNIFFAGNTGGGLQKPKDNDIIKDLKLLCRDQLTVAHDAFRALVNLSDSPLLVASLSEPAFLVFIVSYIIHPESICGDLATMLLSNLTASAAACSALLSLKIPIISDVSLPNGFYATQSRCHTSISPSMYPEGEPTEVLALPLLIDAFVQGAIAGEGGDLSKRVRKGDMNFLSSVFANLSVAPAGRMFFLTPRPSNFLKPKENVEYPLSKLLPFTEHKNTIRRGGVISSMKNCAFYAPAHRALLEPDTEQVAVVSSDADEEPGVAAPGIDILPAILLPLAGPEEFEFDDQEKLPSALQFLPPDKKREQDEVLRLTLIETLLLLCTTKWGRAYQRDNGVYEIVRAAHIVERVEKISEHIERLVTLLKSDEGADHVDESIPDDEIATGEGEGLPPARATLGGEAPSDSVSPLGSLNAAFEAALKVTSAQKKPAVVAAAKVEELDEDEDSKIEEI